MQNLLYPLDQEVSERSSAMNCEETEKNKFKLRLHLCLVLISELRTFVYNCIDHQNHLSAPYSTLRKNTTKVSI